MSADNLVALAEKYISLSAAIEDVRQRMKLVLSNGVDHHPPEPEPRPPTSRPVGRPKSSSAPKASLKAKPAQRGISKPDRARAARAAEDLLLATLKSSGPTARANLARALQSPEPTVAARLSRLASRGLVSRDETGWMAVEAAEASAS
jgi:hypothetical protein